MQMAAEQDPKFKFEASEWPNGHYVHTLAGHKEEPMGYHYWLLYRLPEIPDPASPPGNQLVAPVGMYFYVFLQLNVYISINSNVSNLLMVSYHVLLYNSGFR